MPSKGVNKAIILGNLGADPDIRYTANGTAVANISVATSEEWKDKQSGEKQSRTEWHRIAAFGRLAEIMGEYLSKGSKVYVEGRIQTNKYTDKSNIERFSTQIIANELQMLDSKPTNQGGGQQPQNRSNQADAYRAASTGGQAMPQDDPNDSIPF